MFTSTALLIRRCWLFAIAIGCGFLFVGGIDSYKPPFWHELWNCGHVLLFALLSTYLVYFYTPKHWHRRKTFLILCVATLLVSFFIELIQSFIGRSFSLLDVGRNIAGSTIGFLLTAKKHPAELLYLWSTPRKKIGVRLFWISRYLLALLILLLACLPVLRIAVDTFYRWQQFPVLADFSNALQLERFYPEKFVFIDPQAKRLIAPLDRSGWPGFSFMVSPSDWRGFTALHIDLTVQLNTATTLNLRCRIHDAQHEAKGFEMNDRYNGQFLLSTGQQHIQIALADVEKAPENRQLDLQQVRALMCFSEPQKPGSLLILEKIYLQ